MDTPLSGLRPQTFPEDVLLDSGVLYINDTPFACLTGGLKWTPEVEYRNIPFDGKRADVKGLDRVTMRKGKVSGTVIEMPSDLIGKLEPGVSYAPGQGWSGGDMYVPRKAALLLTDGMYLTNVRAVWLRGNGELFQVRMPCALLTRYDATSQDANEVAIAIEVDARLDLSVPGSTPGDAPYVYEYIPNN
ncbi:MAG: hypothetical protein KIS74_03070 [Burkholderiales bacterium]|nr:hypothetical protein [Burkholderiales bacterium]